jgi:hypothetical protein
MRVIVDVRVREKHVAETCSLWTGEPLPSTTVALALFDPERTAVSGSAFTESIGVAAAGDRVVVLHRHQFENFLKVHAEATLVCWDAAELHWTLHALLRATVDSDTIKTLWQFSRDARLIDLRILDLHIRRLARPRVTAEKCFRDIAARIVGTTVLTEVDIRSRVFAATADACLADGEANLQPAAQYARTMLQAYAKLLEVAQSALMPLIAELRALHRLERPDYDGLTDIEIHQRLLAEFGPLGIAIDVRWDIAVWQVRKTGVRVDAGRWHQFQCWSESRYNEAAKKLLDDRHAKRVFRTTGMTIQRSDSGQPLTDTKKMSAWLKNISDGLCDRNGCPVNWGGSPPASPEHWGAWASCHPLLHAWRVLQRAGPACAKTANDRMLPVFDRQYSPLQTTSPDLAWLQRSRHRPCVPRAGHLFLVCRLQELGLRCLVAVCCARMYAVNSRLEGYFSSSSYRGHLENPGWPVDAAAELWAAWRSIFSSKDHSVVKALKPREQTQEFLKLKTTAPDEYETWIHRTVALFEAIPLGLTPEQLSSFLKLEYDLDLGTNEITCLDAFLTDHTYFELRGFLPDDTPEIFSVRTGINFAAVAADLAQPTHVGTTNAYIRNQLLSQDPQSPVIKMLDNANVSRDVIKRLLQQRGLSLAGRITDESYCAQVRCQEVQYACDEVVKQIAFALVSTDCQLVAVACPEIVLEVSDRGIHTSHVQEIKEIIHRAQERLLADLAAPCSCGIRSDW